MRSMYRGLFAVLVVVLALGVGSSAAMGATWSVNGSTTFGTEALNSAPSKGSIELRSPEDNGIKCETLEVKGGEVVEGGTGSATAVVLGGCRVEYDEAQCTLNSETITTGAVTLDIVNATEIEIAPKPPATEFATYKIKSKPGKTCPLVGTNTIKGDARATVEGAGAEATEHMATFNKDESDIKINGSAAGIYGGIMLKLASGKSWSIQ